MAENIIVPRRREDFFDDQGDPTHRFIRWIEAVTGQTNVTSIVVEDTEQSLTSTSSRVSRNAARINSLELKQLELINTSASITTKPFQLIICENTAPIDITLDPNALLENEVSIIRTNAIVNIIGSVNNKTNLKLNVKGSGPRLVFDNSNSTWWRI